MNNNTSEIEKLTERISKDPKSKLFVPLAEEYKKAGDLEMSIFVLTEGLKNNPGYVTARSLLGKLLIEKGDLTGAEKEFEEVVKAIPDNLMAQKKLGDLYALQDRISEALSRYKTVLTLNPKDSETALLVTEAEAGRDIKKHLFKPKPAATEVQQKKPEHVPSISLQAEQKSAITAAAPNIEATQQAATEFDLEEEAEEVLIVEPLDPEPAIDPGESAAAHEVTPEASDETWSTATEEEKKDTLFSDDDPFGVRTDESEMPMQETDDSFAIAGEQEKQADDFTTDTLAELYISQGFFEKAIDIYERMLVDKPNSQGLKDKLEKVRAMAADSGQEPESEKPERDGISGFDAQTSPRLDDFELPATQEIHIINDDETSSPVKHPRQPSHFDVGFEPKEYIPPDALPRQSKKPLSDPFEDTATHELESLEPNAEQKQAAQTTSAEARKQTVDRLESWLKNIIKET